MVRSILLLLVGAVLSGCMRIPVTVHPPHNEAGEAKALPVAPVGTVEPTADGGAVMNPSLPQPKAGDHPAPPGVPWDLIAMIAGTLGLGGCGWAVKAIRTVGQYRTALKNTSELVEEVAQAETDDDVKWAKEKAAAVQKAAGVHTLVQQTRGKV